jgi:hypothetical protein
MKRLLIVVLSTAMLTALVVAVAASGKGGPQKHGTSGSHGGKTITVIEHATTDATTDTGAPGDSAGDILTFANDVFDAADKSKVGTDQGYCLRVAAGVSYECTWTTFLPGGQIVVNGPFFDTTLNNTLAITGGTGRYRNARGTMDLKSQEDGAKFTFVFHIIG